MKKKDGLEKVREYFQGRSLDQILVEGIEVIQEEHVAGIERLKEQISEFEDLAVIKDWFEVQNDRDTCWRLQEAYNIVQGVEYPREFLEQYRCKPCEMHGLKYIKQIVNKK